DWNVNWDSDSANFWSNDPTFFDDSGSSNKHDSLYMFMNDDSDSKNWNFKGLESIHNKNWDSIMNAVQSQFNSGNIYSKFDSIRKNCLKEMNDSLTQDEKEKMQKGFKLAEQFMKNMDFGFDSTKNGFQFQINSIYNNGKKMQNTITVDTSIKKKGFDDIKKIMKQFNIDVSSKFGEDSSKFNFNMSVAKLEELDEDDKEKYDIPEDKPKLDPETLKIHPNPSDGKFQFNLKTKEKGAVRVRIRSLNGNEVFSEKFQGGTTISENIDISGNEKGVYFLRIVQGNKSLTKKMVIGK
ncbi:MAG: T9SS type A sorting domain-containing protein, partial [Flavobacteriales bacterium]